MNMVSNGFKDQGLFLLHIHKQLWPKKPLKGSIFAMTFDEMNERDQKMLQILGPWYINTSLWAKGMTIDLSTS